MKMTPKERIKAAVEFKPFWPKLDRSYEYKWGKPTQYFHNLIKSDYIVEICNSFTEKRTTTWLVEMFLLE